MSALGSLVVKLALEYAQFTQGLNKSEQEALKHAKNVQDAYDGMAKGIKSTASSIGAAIAGVVSVAGLVSVMKRVRDETIAAEQEQAQLAAALKSTGNAAGFSQEQLNDMAASMSKATTYSAGELNQAQTRLLAYVNVAGEQFPRAMRAAMDMGTRLGMNLNQSMETVAKALDKPSTGMQSLQRQGFKFTESQIEMAKALENSGRMADAQAIVFAELESSYGGAAEAARDTMGGAIKALGNTINDILTADSASFPAMRQSLEDLNTTLSAESTRAAFQTFTGWVLATGSAAVRAAANLVTFLNIVRNADPQSQATQMAGNLKQRSRFLTDQAEMFTQLVAADPGNSNYVKQLTTVRSELDQVSKSMSATSDTLKGLAGDNKDVTVATAATTAAVQQQGVAAGKTEAYLKKYGTSAQKAAIEIAEWKAKLGDAFTPEMEAKIKAQYAKQDAGAKGASQSVKQLQTAYVGLIKSIDDKIAEQRLELEQGDKLSDADKLRLKYQSDLQGSLKGLSTAERSLAEAKLNTYAALEKENEARKELNKAIEEDLKAAERLSAARESAVQSVEESLKNARAEEEAYWLSTSASISLAEAVEELAIARLEDQLAMARQGAESDQVIQQLERELAARRGLMSIMQQRGVREANKKVADETVKDWEQTSQTIGRTLADYIMGGGKDAAQYLKRLFATLVLEPTVQTLASAAMGGSGAAGQSGGLGGSGSLNSSFTDWSSWGSKGSNWLWDQSLSMNLSGWESTGEIVGQLGDTLNGVDSWLQEIPGMEGGIGAAAGYLGALYSLTQGNYGEAVGAAIGTYILPGIGTMIGSFLGGLVDQFTTSRGANHAGAAASSAGVGNTVAAGQIFGSTEGDWYGDVTKRYSAEADQKLSATVNALSDVYSSLTKFAGDSARQIDVLGAFVVNGVHDDESAYGYGQLRDSVTGQILSAFTNRDLGSDTGKAWEGWLNQMGGLIVEQVKQADIASYVRTALNSIGDEVTIDGLNTALQQIAAMELLFKSWTRNLSSFSGMADTTFEKLVQRMGGVSGAAETIGSYYQNFYSESERTANATRDITEALARVGIALPKTREEFRALVDANAALGDAGVNTVSVLLGVQDAFAALVPATDAAAEAAAEMAGIWTDTLRGLLGESRNLEAEYLRAIGDSEGYQWMLRDIATAGMSEAERAVWDYNEALRQSTQKLDELTAKQQEVDSLEQSLAGITGTAVKSAQDLLQQAMSNVQATEGFRATLANSIESARMQAMDPSARAAYLRNKEAGLWNQLDTAADPLAVAQQIQQTLMDRIQLEADLRGQVDGNSISSLQEQLSLQKSLGSAAAAMQNTVDGLRLGSTSALNPVEQLKYAANKFNDAVARADAGDLDAWKDIQSFGQTYNSLGRDVYASSPEAAAIFDRITSTMDRFAAQGADVDPTVEAINKQIELQKAGNASADQSAWIAQQTQEALTRLDGALKPLLDKQLQQQAEALEAAKLEIALQREANELARLKLQQDAAAAQKREQQHLQQLEQSKANMRNLEAMLTK